MPGTQILPERSDNYRSSTTDQQNRQLFSARPAWSANLQAANTVTVRGRGEAFTASVRMLTATDRQHAWRKILDGWPSYSIAQDVQGTRVPHLPAHTPKPFLIDRHSGGAADAAARHHLVGNEAFRETNPGAAAVRHRRTRTSAMRDMKARARTFTSSAVDSLGAWRNLTGNGDQWGIRQIGETPQPARAILGNNRYR
jgi:hypothetical protein